MTTAALVVEERSSVEFDDLAEECWPALIKNGVHHGGDLELIMIRYIVEITLFRYGEIKHAKHFLAKT